MQLKQWIGKLQSPSFQAVAAIAQYAGGGMTVARFHSIRFPTGTVQVWEFTPALPPLDRPPVVVAVFLRRGRPETWTPVADRDYDAALRHYGAFADECRQRARGQAVAPKPSTTLVVPGLPPGVRITLPGGQPLTIGGRPVAFAAAGGAP